MSSSLALIKAVRSQRSKLLKKPTSCNTVKLHHEQIMASSKPAYEHKPVVFLHGLFGSSSSFKVFAQNQEI